MKTHGIKYTLIHIKQILFQSEYRNTPVVWSLWFCETGFIFKPATFKIMSSQECVQNVINCMPERLVTFVESFLTSLMHITGFFFVDITLISFVGVVLIFFGVDIDMCGALRIVNSVIIFQHSIRKQIDINFHFANN
jgi:hypothetical protein